MNPAPTLACLALFVAASSPARAQMTPLKELPGMGKATRAGYTITVEGGEEGDRTVTYSGDGRPAGGDSVRLPRPAPNAVPRVPATPAPRPGAPAPAPAPAGAQGASPKRPEPEGEIDSPLNRVTKREDNLSGKRFGRESSEYFTRDEKFDSRDPVAYGRWSGASQSYDRKRAQSVDFSERFATPRAEETQSRRVFYGTRDRELYARSGERAEVPGWTERFSRDKSEKFSDPDRGSRLRDRMTEGYKALTQVSMQDINKFQFRRSHSTVKGELPVGRIGAEGTTPMRPEALPNR